MKFSTVLCSLFIFNVAKRNYYPLATHALEFRTPPFSSFDPSRDYGMDLSLEVYP